MQSHSEVQFPYCERQLVTNGPTIWWVVRPAITAHMARDYGSRLISTVRPRILRLSKKGGLERLSNRSKAELALKLAKSEKLKAAHRLNLPRHYL